MDSENVFGERVLALRAAAGLTQQQVGEAIGMTKQAIKDIEKGRRQTTISKAVHMARFFNTTVEYLCGDTDVIDRPNGWKS